MEYAKDNIKFHDLIESTRKKKNISRHSLCRGLCSISQMNYILCGERLPDYQMRNRIMSRLGISQEGYEDYVHYDEYYFWYEYQKIIIAIEDFQLYEAEKKIESLEKRISERDFLCKQMIFDAKAKICEIQQSDYKVLADYYDSIVNLSMDKMNFFDIRDDCVSYIEEIYLSNWLYANAMITKSDDELLRYYQALKKLIEKINVDDADIICKAKALPYVLSKFYDLVRMKHCKKYSIFISRQALNAISLLKKSERTYYLGEMVEILENVKNYSGKGRQLYWQAKRVWNFIEVLKVFYNNNIPMNQSGYMYRDSDVFCIADVIHDRRKMLGISRNNLSEGICTLRTIERIEGKKVKPQQEIIKSIFLKLGLEPEYRKTEIITDDVVTIDLFDKYRCAVNEYDIEEIKKICEILVKKIDKSYITNKQVLIRILNQQKLILKEIDSEQYVKNLKIALGLSVTSTNSKAIERFYTNSEMVLKFCIGIREKNSLHIMDMKELFLNKKSPYYYTNYKRRELISSFEASRLGNLACYDESNEISKLMIKSSLRFNRLHGIHKAVYNLWWNNEHNSNSDLSYQKIYIEGCIDVCEFSDRKITTEFYKSQIRV